MAARTKLAAAYKSREQARFEAVASIRREKSVTCALTAWVSDPKCADAPSFQSSPRARRFTNGKGTSLAATECIFPFRDANHTRHSCVGKGYGGFGWCRTSLTDATKWGGCTPEILTRGRQIGTERRLGKTGVWELNKKYKAEQVAGGVRRLLSTVGADDKTSPLQAWSSTEATVALIATLTTTRTSATSTAAANAWMSLESHEKKVLAENAKDAGEWLRQEETSRVKLAALERKLAIESEAETQFDITRASYGSGTIV